MNSNSSQNKSNFKQIDKTLKKLNKSNHNHSFSQEQITLINALHDSINQLRLQVEFDHEQRISAIEDFLQEL